MTKLQVLELELDSVQAYHLNPRRGDVEGIAESLRVHGQYRPIVVNLGTHTGRPYEVLAGNHTAQAARSLGWSTIEATTVDVDDDTAARIVLVDNRGNDLAGYDDEALAELLGKLDGLEGTGYSQDDLAALLASLEEVEWGDDNLGDALEAADRSAWPIIRVQVEPAVAEAFRTVEGETDEERFVTVLRRAGL